MSLRPAPARWFELVTVRTQLARAVAALARTGAVELEADSGERAPGLALPDLEPQLRAWAELVRRYGAYWPAAETGSGSSQEPAPLLEAALRRIAAWRIDADPLIDRIERLEAAARELGLLDEALDAAADTALPPLDLLARADGRIRARLIAYPSDRRAREAPPVLMRQFNSSAHAFFLVVGRARDVREIEAEATGLKGVVVPLPEWLPADRTQAVRKIGDRQRTLTEERDRVRTQLAALSDRHGVAAAVGDLRLVAWLDEHARELRASERLVWATGWTSDGDAARLRAALAKEGVHALLRLTEPPPGRSPPILLRNPRWARGFEAFVRMLGTPAGGEADPSVLLAIIAPALFGFMFADVGQGLIIAAVGLWLRRRIPFLSILVPGGLLAALFGVLFGSVFCREDLFAPLWMHPLAQPLTMLAAALAAGAALLSLGLLIDALQHVWRGAGAHWLASRAGLAVAYVGLIATPLSVQTAWLIALGGLWFIVGAAAARSAAGARLVVAGSAAAEFVEQAFQLAINTLSFARIGAFALAHAGLSGAVVGLADAAGGLGYWLVLALGNALIIGLEGLVVGIQTTRLLLFEFFIRFLKGGGREFKPLTPPLQDAAPASGTHLQTGRSP